MLPVERIVRVDPLRSFAVRLLVVGEHNARRRGDHDAAGAADAPVSEEVNQRGAGKGAQRRTIAADLHEAARRLPHAHELAPCAVGGIASERLAVFGLLPVHEAHHVLGIAAGRPEVEGRLAVARQIVGHGRADNVALRVRDADFGDVHLPRKGLERRRVVGVAIVEGFAHSHALADEPLVYAVDYLGFDVLERAVNERIGVPLREVSVKEPCEGHRQRERRQHAEGDLQVEVAPRHHFATPSAMTALAAASTSGRRLSTATP